MNVMRMNLSLMKKLKLIIAILGRKGLLRLHSGEITTRMNICFVVQFLQMLYNVQCTQRVDFSHPFANSPLL